MRPPVSRHLACITVRKPYLTGVYVSSHLNRFFIIRVSVHAACFFAGESLLINKNPFSSLSLSLSLSLFFLFIFFDDQLSQDHKTSTSSPSRHFWFPREHGSVLNFWQKEEEKKKKICSPPFFTVLARRSPQQQHRVHPSQFYCLLCFISCLSLLARGSDSPTFPRGFSSSRGLSLFLYILSFVKAEFILAEGRLSTSSRRRLGAE